MSLLNTQMLAAFGAYTIGRWLDYPVPQYRHHGIGVLQGYVLEAEVPFSEYRLHVWDPQLRLPDMTDSGLIHDHRFELESTVLVGRIHHTVYTLERDDRGAFQVWEVQHARAVSDGVGWVKLESDQRFKHSTITMKYWGGQHYHFGKRRFHRTDVDELTVTFCKKRLQVDEPARILSRVGKEPRHGFDHDQNADLELKRDILDRARHKLAKIARQP